MPPPDALVAWKKTWEIGPVQLAPPSVDFIMGNEGILPLPLKPPVVKVPRMTLLRSQSWGDVSMGQDGTMREEGRTDVVEDQRAAVGCGVFSSDLGGTVDSDLADSVSLALSGGRACQSSYISELLEALSVIAVDGWCLWLRVCGDEGRRKRDKSEEGPHDDSVVDVVLFV